MMDAPTQGRHSMAVNAKELAKMLGVSLRHIRRMDAAGKLPRPVTIGHTKRWLVAEIGEWLEAGAPDRAAWEQNKKQIRRGKDAA